MEFPLQVKFKIVAIAPQIQVLDAAGNSVCFVRQKLLKLKEQVEVFRDSSRENRLCQIKADRIIDFSASYEFVAEDESSIGAIRRKGMRSIWRANYEITDGSQTVMKLNEEKPFVKVMDGIFSDIPIVGMLAGYVFHPSYLITDAQTEAPLLRVKKQPAMWEGKFTVEKLGELEPQNELRAVLGILMMMLLERARG